MWKLTSTDTPTIAVLDARDCHYVCAPKMDFLMVTYSSADSDWVSMIDSDVKSSEGKTVGEVLLDVIEAFPKNNLGKDGSYRGI